MSLLDDKFTIVSAEKGEGFLQPFQVETTEGTRGRLYWFEVHSPEARTAFHRYKNAIRRLESQNLLPQGVMVSANPGRYYAFWPEHTRIALKPKRLKPILDVLEPFGYKETDLEASDESGRALVGNLKPQISVSNLPLVENNPILTPPIQPSVAPLSRPSSTALPITPSKPTVEIPPAPATSKLETPVKLEVPSSATVSTVNTPAANSSAANMPTKSKPAKKKPRLPERRFFLNWPGWIPGLLMLGLGGYLAWTTTLRFLNPPEYVLPELTGKTPREALEAVRTFGLKVEFAEGSDPAKPKDQILDQTPDASTRVKPGRRLELVINKPRFGTVPTLNGRSLQDAQQALEAAGYPVLGITRIASTDTRDTILSSIPRENQPLRQGEGVRLLVSTGVRPSVRETVLPDLSGLTQEQAKYILTIAELQPQFVQVASGAPSGQVVGQAPGPGIILNRDTAIRVFIAGQPSASIPSSSPFEPPRLSEPPPPPEPQPQPVPETPPETQPSVEPVLPAPNPNSNPTNPNPQPANPQPTPQPPSQPTPQPTPPVATGPQERRVTVTYSLSADQYPQGAVVAIVVQDEVRVNTIFEGPVEAGYVFPPTEVIVQGTAILRVVVNGQTVVESPL